MKKSGKITDRQGGAVMREPTTCAECGGSFWDYDGAPRLWCSVYCETQPARFAAVEARGAAAERAAVVAYLRDQGDGEGGLHGWVMENLSNAIERGEHRREEEE